MDASALPNWPLGDPRWITVGAVDADPPSGELIAELRDIFAPAVDAQRVDAAGKSAESERAA
jgi:hypothetical protein